MIDETVKAAKEFLEKHPEERKRILLHGKESLDFHGNPGELKRLVPMGTNLSG